jgi:hypothetical protein
MKYYTILLFFTVCFLVDCELKEDEKRDFQFDSDRFYKEKQLWERSGIKSYTFTQDFFSESTGPNCMKVSVTKGRSTVLSCEREKYNKEQVGMSGLYCDAPKTISEIYSYIEDMTRSDKKAYDSETLRLVKYEITYDQEYHYPKMAEETIAWTNNGLGGGFMLEITEFKKE